MVAALDHSDDYAAATALLYAYHDEPDPRDPYEDSAPSQPPYPGDEMPSYALPDDSVASRVDHAIIDDYSEFDFVQSNYDLADHDWIQDEYAAMLEEDYVPDDDPLWHDFSIDTHRWYSEEDGTIDIPAYIDAISERDAPSVRSKVARAKWSWGGVAIPD